MKRSEFKQLIRRELIKEAKGTSYESKLAEIEKQGHITTLEAKIDALAEMIEAKNSRLSLVSEDENLSELIDKKKIKEMQKEIKLLEKTKLKLEKLYEKKSGSRKKDVVVDEEEKSDDFINPGNTEEDQAKKDDYNLDAMPAHMKEGKYSTYEEDGNDSVNEDFDDVVDDIMDQGKSKEDAENIAGAINRDHVGNYRQEESISEFNLREYLADNNLTK
tara:strand:+ start:366 stop:1019 length:654 start_codon:yes stop_codon:yes gene_type:complete